jgi:hypothetical protein
MNNRKIIVLMLILFGTKKVFSDTSVTLNAQHQNTTTSFRHEVKSKLVEPYQEMRKSKDTATESMKLLFDEQDPLIYEDSLVALAKEYKKEDIISMLIEIRDENAGKDSTLESIVEDFSSIREDQENETHIKKETNKEEIDDIFAAMYARIKDDNAKQANPAYKKIEYKEYLANPKEYKKEKKEELDIFTEQFVVQFYNLKGDFKSEIEHCVDAYNMLHYTNIKQKERQIQLLYKFICEKRTKNEKEKNTNEISLVNKRMLKLINNTPMAFQTKFKIENFILKNNSNSLLCEIVLNKISQYINSLTLIQWNGLIIDYIKMVEDPSLNLVSNIDKLQRINSLDTNNFNFLINQYIDGLDVIAAITVQLQTYQQQAAQQPQNGGIQQQIFALQNAISTHVNNFYAFYNTI